MTTKLTKNLIFHRDDLHRPGAGVIREFIIDHDAQTITQFDDGEFVVKSDIGPKADDWIKALTGMGFTLATESSQTRETPAT